MKRIGKTAIALTAGGALALGGIAVAVPVLAGAGPGGPGGPPAAGRTVGPGRPWAGGGMNGMMGQGFQRGPGDGTCLSLSAPGGSVTAAQKAAQGVKAADVKRVTTG